MNFEKIASFLCHRMPERSFDGFIFCGRCFGIYAGIAIGMFLFFLSKEKKLPRIPDLIAYCVCIVIMYLEILSEMLFGITANNEIRAFSGLLFGLGVSLLLLSVNNYLKSKENSVSKNTRSWQWITGVLITIFIIVSIKFCPVPLFFNILQVVGFAGLYLILLMLIISAIRFSLKK